MWVSEECGGGICSGRWWAGKLRCVLRLRRTRQSNGVKASEEFAREGRCVLLCRSLSLFMQDFEDLANIWQTTICFEMQETARQMQHKSTL
jgi:hypothetical protein